MFQQHTESFKMDLTTGTTLHRVMLVNGRQKGSGCFFSLLLLVAIATKMNCYYFRILWKCVFYLMAFPSSRWRNAWIDWLYTFAEELVRCKIASCVEARDFMHCHLNRTLSGHMQKPSERMFIWFYHFALISHSSLQHTLSNRPEPVQHANLCRCNDTSMKLMRKRVKIDEYLAKMLENIREWSLQSSTPNNEE